MQEHHRDDRSGTPQGNPQPPLGSPLFRGKGRTAHHLFQQLEQPLSPEIKTSGTLESPHGTITRTAIRRAITEHDRSPAEETIWLALRLDAIDIGRRVYDGKVPAIGEPSWREVGAIGLERLIQNIRGLIDELDDYNDHNKRLIASTVNLSAGLRGHSFNLYTSGISIDNRFAYLELSWVATPKEPISVPFGQTALINAILDIALSDRERLKDEALKRFPRGINLQLELLSGFSSEEAAEIGIDPEKLRRQLELSRRQPDVIPVDREEFEGFPSPRDAPEHFVDHELEEPDFISELTNESPDVKELRDTLNLSGFNLDVIPDNPESPSKPYLTETYAGLRVMLELKEDFSLPRMTEAGNLAKKLASAIADTPASEYISFQFQYLGGLSAEVRPFLEIDLKLPEWKEENKEERYQRMYKIFELLLENDEHFVTKRP